MYIHMIYIYIHVKAIFYIHTYFYMPKQSHALKKAPGEVIKKADLKMRSLQLLVGKGSGGSKRYGLRPRIHTVSMKGLTRALLKDPLSEMLTITHMGLHAMHSWHVCTSWFGHWLACVWVYWGAFHLASALLALA